MSDQGKQGTAEFMQLRRQILKTLYQIFIEFPYTTVELKEIENRCRTDVNTLNWNVVYLEKCGYVELGRSYESPPYIACSAVITVDGIDLVENEAEFNRRFPAGSR